MKQVANMTGSLGRCRRFSILVVTGNKKGLVGVALSKAIDAKSALRKAKNLSMKKLRFIEMFENRTVYHDFHHQIDSTAVFVKRRPAGNFCWSSVMTGRGGVCSRDDKGKPSATYSIQILLKNSQAGKGKKPNNSTKAFWTLFKFLEYNITAVKQRFFV